MRRLSPAAGHAAEPAALSISNNFNLIRLLMAGLVIFSHGFALLGHAQPRLLGTDCGTLAVHVFFALSGYLITLSWIRRPDLPHFVARRALRLLPALGAAIAYTKLASVYTDGFSDAVVAGNGNGSLWTIPWEVTCYIACAAVGLFAVFRPDRFLLFFVSCWTIALAEAGRRGAGFPPVSWMLLFFLTGAFIAVNEPGLPMRRLGPLAAAWLAASALLGGALPAVLIDKLETFLVPPAVLSTLVQVCTCLAVSFLTIYLGKHMRTVIPLREDYSYGLYVFAWPTQQLLIGSGLFSLWPSPLILFPVAMTTTLPLAMLSWHLIEKPALHLRQRRAGPAAGVPGGAWPGRPHAFRLVSLRLRRRLRVARHILARWPGLASTWSLRLLAGAITTKQSTGFSVGFLALCVAISVRVLLGASFLGFPFITFFPAALVTALVAGWLPATLFAAVEMFLAYRFFAAPPAGWPLHDASNQIGFTLDLLTVCLEIAFASTLRHALRLALGGDAVPSRRQR